MDERTAGFLTSPRGQKVAAVALILGGLFQVAGGLAQDTLPWTLFYAITGLGVALSGALFLRNARQSVEE